MRQIIKADEIRAARGLSLEKLRALATLSIQKAEDYYQSKASTLSGNILGPIGALDDFGYFGTSREIINKAKELFKEAAAINDKEKFISSWLMANNALASIDLQTSSSDSYKYIVRPFEDSIVKPISEKVVELKDLAVNKVNQIGSGINDSFLILGVVFILTRSLENIIKK